jgi:hypothetical protein
MIYLFLILFKHLIFNSFVEFSQFFWRFKNKLITLGPKMQLNLNTKAIIILVTGCSGLG